MEQNNSVGQENCNRSEPRTIVDKYYSVEFSFEELESVYQFRIWDLSEGGMCVLVREDSAVLEYLKAGKTFDMKYYATDLPGKIEQLETEVKHVSKDEQGRFKGHVMVGLKILESDSLN
jgi:hypothetical protein